MKYLAHKRMMSMSHYSRVSNALVPQPQLSSLLRFSSSTLSSSFKTHEGVPFVIQNSKICFLGNTPNRPREIQKGNDSTLPTLLTDGFLQFGRSAAAARSTAASETLTPLSCFCTFSTLERSAVYYRQLSNSFNGKCALH